MAEVIFNVAVCSGCNATLPVSGLSEYEKSLKVIAHWIKESNVSRVSRYCPGSNKAPKAERKVSFDHSRTRSRTETEKIEMPEVNNGKISLREATSSRE
jgi:hypothetical protein